MFLKPTITFDIAAQGYLTDRETLRFSSESVASRVLWPWMSLLPFGKRMENVSYLTWQKSHP